MPPNDPTAEQPPFLREQPGVAGGRGLVLVVCDLRQQDRSSVAAGEEDSRPAARLTGRWCPQRSEVGGFVHEIAVFCIRS
ncbi:hypothetical protein INR49_006917 [Caranx melampygus]|nr:hypothetical protein INR49_006917 [Caranx melampygus]